MPGRALVVDANILVRAVLGKRTRHIIDTYAESATFFVPEPAYRDAEEYTSSLTMQRGGDPAIALALLRTLAQLVDVVGSEVYADFEDEARKRLAGRDLDDWPILAAALALGCPIWTEDTDFFGCGVPTWTSDRVELFLQERAEPPAFGDTGA